jgi:hypothetical protein
MPGLMIVLLTLAALVVLFFLARTDRSSIRDERNATRKAAVNLYNIDFTQRSRTRQRLMDYCRQIPLPLPYPRCRTDALAESPSMPPANTFHAAYTAMTAAYNAQWEGRKLAWVAMAIAFGLVGVTTATLVTIVTASRSQPTRL